MSSKRKSEEPALTPRDKKKQKTILARTIAVQPTTGSVSGTGTLGQTSEAGPSRAVHFDSKLLKLFNQIRLIVLQLGSPSLDRLTWRDSRRYVHLRLSAYFPS